MKGVIKGLHCNTIFWQADEIIVLDSHSHDVASGSDWPCNKIEKPLVVYIFSKVMQCRPL